MNTCRSKRGGQAPIELALMIPFLLLAIANVVNFGGMFYAAITVSSAGSATQILVDSPNLDGTLGIKMALRPCAVPPHTEASANWLGHTGRDKTATAISLIQESS